MAEDQGYFSQGNVDPTQKGMFAERDELLGFHPAPGVMLQPVGGGKLLMSFVTFQPRSLVPEHAHDEEQMGTVIEGEVEVDINGDRRTLRKGGFYYIPPNAAHTVRAGTEGAFVVEAFTPPRKGLVEAAQEEGARSHGDV